MEAFGKHFADNINPVLTAHAAEQVRRNTLPANADAYEVKTSQAFQVPQGQEFRLNTNDPMWAQAKAWAHKNGLSQDAFMEAIDLVAGRDLFNEQAVRTAINAEIQKLGTTGPARIDAITRFYKGTLGEEGARLMMSRVFNAADVQAHEKLIAKFASQGAANFTNAGREPAGPQGRVSDEDYAKMSPGDRFNYARGFDQRQFQNGGAR